MAPKKKPKIIDGKLCWQCSKCRAWLPLRNYYNNKAASNGLFAQCKKCSLGSRQRTTDMVNKRRLNREHMRRARGKDPEKFKKIHRESNKRNPCPKHKAKAIGTLNYAVLMKRIERPKICEECNEEHARINGHHEDYSKPLDVIWLCPECHGRRHWKKNSEWVGTEDVKNGDKGGMRG